MDKLVRKRVTITIDEAYKSLYYKKEKYDEYRNVINAAADFNKLAFIITKEKT